MLDLPVSLNGNDVLVETFFLLTACDVDCKVFDTFAGDTSIIEVNVFRLVIGNIVGKFCNDLILITGFDVTVLLIVEPDRVNILFVVFVFVPVDRIAVCIVCHGVFEIVESDSNGLLVLS